MQLVNFTFWKMPETRVWCELSLPITLTINANYYKHLPATSVRTLTPKNEGSTI